MRLDGLLGLFRGVASAKIGSAEIVETDAVILVVVVTFPPGLLLSRRGEVECGRCWSACNRR